MATAYIVAGLARGDEGKGKMVDYLCRRYSPRAVIRYNGGAQAAHNVVTTAGTHHTFAQFGAGSFVGVPTWLSRHMIVDPIALGIESDVLAGKIGGDPLRMVMVDPRCVVATPYHQAAGRLNADKHGHGSTGMGVGEAYLGRYAPYALRWGDLVDGTTDLVASKLRALRDQYTGTVGHAAMDEWVDLTDTAARGYALEMIAVALICATAPVEAVVRNAQQTLVFEGAQGALLDQWRGEHPHTTWSNTTPENALDMLVGTRMDPHVIGVTRTYGHRHGPGPLFLEHDPPQRHHEPRNPTNRWQGEFRTGPFCARDLVAGIKIAGRVDSIAVTHADVDSTKNVDLALLQLDAASRPRVKWVSSGPTADATVEL